MQLKSGGNSLIPAAMTGFCSCKTGIHTIPGNNLGAAAEAGAQWA